MRLGELFLMCSSVLAFTAFADHGAGFGPGALYARDAAALRFASPHEDFFPGGFERHVFLPSFMSSSWKQF